MLWGCLIAGFIILANPVIHVVDILPDAVGFFLIAAALTKTSYYVGYIGKARDGFMKLAFLEIIKFFSIVLIPYSSGSAKILLTFVFSLAELILFIPALNSLFEGISFIGLWYGGDAIYAKKVKKKKTVELISSTKNYILFFYILRIAATLLPELTELQMYDNIGEVKALQNRLTYYKPFLYIVCSLAVVICGIILVVKITSYFSTIKRDKQLNDALDTKYQTDILPRTTLFTAKNMKNALLIFAFSVICEFVLTADSVNLMVGIIPSALLIASALIVRKYEKKSVIIIPFAAVRGVLSIVNLVLQIRYFSEYSVEAIDWISTAYDQYYTMAMLIAAEKIIALVSVLIFYTILMKTIKNQLEIFGVKTDTAQYSKKNRDLETYNTVGGKILMCVILSIINYSFAAAHAYMAASMSLATLINSVITLIYIAYVIYTVILLDDLIYDKELEIA